MAITFFGRTAVPTDNGSQSGASFTITPPGSMAANDYVLVFALLKNGVDVGLSFSASGGNTGGQTWTQETTNEGSGSFQSRLIHCRFNGTWSANPVLSNTSGNTANMSALMLVFRGVDTTTAMDVSPTSTDYGAPSSPFDVTASAITINTAGAMAVYWFGSVDDNSWTVQTASWTHPSGETQWRNLDSTDTSMSAVYREFASTGSTGTVTNRQTANGGDAGNYWSLALKPAAGGGPTPVRYRAII